MKTLSKTHQAKISKLKSEWVALQTIDEREFLKAYRVYIEAITPTAGDIYDGQFERFAIGELKASYLTVLNSNPSELVLYNTSVLYTKSLQKNKSRSDIITTTSDIHALLTAILSANLYITAEASIGRSEELLKEILNVQVKLNQGISGNGAILPVLDILFDTAWVAIIGTNINSAPDAHKEVWKNQPALKNNPFSVKVEPASTVAIPDSLTP